MPTRHWKREGLTGADGLAAAIIHQAVIDAIQADAETMRDAWAYFGSEWYRFKADALGIPSDTWPAALVSTSVDDFIGITNRLRGQDAKQTTTESDRG